MPGKWDTAMKHLVSENPEQFIQWLLPGAKLTSQATLKPVNLNDREIEADNVIAAQINDIDCLAHYEYQTYSDETIAKRMWEYNVLATFSYQRPTYSFLIYLKKCQVTEPFFSWIFPNGEKVHHFRFKVIEVFRLRAAQIKQTGLVGLFPMMVLTKDGKRPAVVDDTVDSIQASGSKSTKELLALTYILASLVFEKETERTWLKRRFRVLQNVLRDAWAYQEILQEGWEEGLQKGLQEGLEQGLEQGRQEGLQEGQRKERQQRLKDQRQMLLTVTQMHFPNLVPLAQKQAKAITDPEALQALVLKLLAAQTEEQAQQALLAVAQKKKGR